MSHEEDYEHERIEIEEVAITRAILDLLAWSIYAPIKFVWFRLRGGHRGLVQKQFADKFPERTILSIETAKLPGRPVKRSTILDEQGDTRRIDFDYRDEVWTWLSSN
jgi:hypothetical protein